ncbi:hypothetical protein DINM_000349 [Dirofilaria immitis]|nr:hypothetical protein [Dirofilaria immitis]
MVLSGCFIVLIFSIAILPIVRSSKQCGNEYIPLGWCKQHCPGLLLNRKWCLLSNLTHDIKCCLHNRCNWEQMPIFVITKRKFKFLPGMKILAHLLTPFVLFIFTICPIASTFIHKWMKNLEVMKALAEYKSSEKGPIVITLMETIKRCFQISVELATGLYIDPQLHVTILVIIETIAAGQLLESILSESIPEEEL